MRPSLRFLALVVVGWAGIRWAMIGHFPAASLFEPTASQAKPAPPIVATQFPAVAPLDPAPMEPAAYEATAAQAPLAATAQMRPAMMPVYYYGVGSVHVPLPPARPAPQAQLTPLIPMPARPVDPQYPPISDFPFSHLASLAWPQQSSAVVVPGQSVPAVPGKAKIDRIQLSMWAYLRSPQGMAPVPPSLATGGTLGGSQAGARLFYNINRQIAAVLRYTSGVGRRGGEAALGVRVHPLQSVPVWVTAERRQRIGKYGDGRSAWALFAEGGVYERPLAAGFVLDGYAQAGIVGARRRDVFADGGVTVTRPVYKKFSAGIGVWAGTQPGAYRVDVGPRVTMRLRNHVRVHFDYRQRVAGNARPGSGPAVTLAGDF